MIPKIIHYCWFGKNPLPKQVLHCIESWKKFLPDYEIKEWNEDNFDVNEIQFTREAYRLKRYAFVSDYVRIYALYHEGGIYIDTDVEVLKSFGNKIDNRSFMGIELRGRQIATAVLGSEPKEKWAADMMCYYQNMPFIKWWGKLNSTPNPLLFNRLFEKYGFDYLDKEYVLENGTHLYPSMIFCGKDYETGNYIITEDTICVHHFAGSWVDKDNRTIDKWRRLFRNLKLKYFSL